MAKREVIARKYLPSHIPVIGLIVWAMVLERFKVPGWVWGIYLTLGTLWSLAIIISIGWGEERRVPKWDDTWP